MNLLKYLKAHIKNKERMLCGACNHKNLKYIECTSICEYEFLLLEEYRKNNITVVQLNRYI